MQPTARPYRWSALSGLGVAGTVLGAVIVACALASAYVAFDVWPKNPSSAGADPLTLDSPASASTARRHGVKIAVLAVPAGGPAADRAAARVRTAATSAPRAGGVPGRRAGLTGPRPVHRQPTSASTFASDPTGPDPVRPPPQRPAAPARQQGALASVGATVDTTTQALARTVRSAADGLATGVAPLSPQLAATLQSAGQGLGGAVETLGVALAGLLGHERPAQESPAPQRPELRPPPPDVTQAAP